MEYKQVFIVNSDLGMGKGKIAVQVAHGEVYYMEGIMASISDRTLSSDRNMTFNKWRSTSDGLMKKVVLKATEQEMNQIYSMLENKGIWKRRVIDRGLTQIEAGSFTCLVVEPLLEEQCNELFGHLKLL